MGKSEPGSENGHQRQRPIFKIDHESSALALLNGTPTLLATRSAVSTAQNEAIGYSLVASIGLRCWTRMVGVKALEVHTGSHTQHRCILL